MSATHLDHRLRQHGQWRGEGRFGPQPPYSNWQITTSNLVNTFGSVCTPWCLSATTCFRARTLKNTSARTRPRLTRPLTTRCSNGRRTSTSGKKPPPEHGGHPEALLKRADKLEKMLPDHSLPEGLETMAYPKFLEERCRLMAAIIRKGFASHQ